MITRLLGVYRIKSPAQNVKFSVILGDVSLLLQNHYLMSTFHFVVSLLCRHFSQHFARHHGQKMAGKCEE